MVENSVLMLKCLKVGFLCIVCSPEAFFICGVGVGWEWGEGWGEGCGAGGVMPHHPVFA